MEPSISELVAELVSGEEFTQESLAAELGVSASAISRWQSGQSTPRAYLEGRLRTLHSAVRERAARYAVKAQIDLDLGGEAEVRAALDRTLRELREIFHRRARLAGRSEALDEVSKLLFAHVVSLANHGTGINRRLLDAGTRNGAAPAEALAAFVSDVFACFLPKSLAHEISLTEFQLRLKPQETLLAHEIVRCFEELSDTPGIVGPNGIEIVDLLNEVFGKFLADSFVDEKQLGQYLTPTEVVRFMVQLAIGELNPDERAALTSLDRCREFGFVLDPSCGVGSLLAEFVRAVHGQLHRDSDEDTADRWLHEILRHVTVGVDKSERMVRYALTNMAMFGLPMAHLRLGNSLARSDGDGAAMAELDGRVGLILTNPPFGAEFSAEDVAHYRIARASRSRTARLSSEVLFLERYLDWLRPGGQLVAIVPDSVLTNRGIFAALREQLRADITVRNVVSLPSVTFASSGTTTKTSVLHLRKRGDKAKPTSRCLVAVCSEIGYTIGTRGTHRLKTVTGPGELPEILRAAQDPRAVEGIGRIVHNLEDSARWDAGFHAALSADLEHRITSAAAEVVRVRDVASLSRDRVDPRRGVGTFQYIEISDVDTATSMCYAKSVDRLEAPSRARKLVRAGDVLVSTVRPDRRIVGVVADEQDGAVCTTGFAVLRPTIDPLVLAYLLRTDAVTSQVLRYNIGIAYPAIDEEILLDIVLPASADDLTNMEPLAEEIIQLENQLRRKRSAIASLVDSANQGWDRLARVRTG